MPLLDPDVADLAPSVPALTAYDELHAVTYLGMLDADATGADCREVARIVLHIDPYREPGAQRGVRDPSRPRQMDKGWDTGTCFAAAGLGRETADGCKFRSAATRQLFISRRTSTGLRYGRPAAPRLCRLQLTSDPVGILVAPLNRARSFGQKGTFAAGIGPVGRGAK